MAEAIARSIGADEPPADADRRRSSPARAAPAARSRIAVGDVVIALENAVYSVISPEGCASILWRTPDEAPTAAVAMRMTAAEQLALGVIDDVVAEPGEGAHAEPDETAAPAPSRSSSTVSTRSPR